VSELAARVKYEDDLSSIECIKVESQLKQAGNNLYLPPGESSLQRRMDEMLLDIYRFFCRSVLE
jgi:hypothetical protein